MSDWEHACFCPSIHWKSGTASRQHSVVQSKNCVFSLLYNIYIELINIVHRVLLEQALHMHDLFSTYVLMWTLCCEKLDIPSCCEHSIQRIHSLEDDTIITISTASPHTLHTRNQQSGSVALHPHLISSGTPELVTFSLWSQSDLNVLPDLLVFRKNSVSGSLPHTHCLTHCLMHTVPLRSVRHGLWISVWL